MGGENNPQKGVEGARVGGWVGEREGETEDGGGRWQRGVPLQSRGRGYRKGFRGGTGHGGSEGGTGRGVRGGGTGTGSRGRERESIKETEVR